MLSRVLALLGALPVGVHWLIATAVGRQPARGASERAASPVVPAIIGLLLILAILPLLFAGLELIIHRTSAKDLVDRVTGPSLQLVELEGLAQLPPLPAPPRDDGAPTGYYFVRDSASARDVVVVRSEQTPAELMTREVTGIIVEDAERLRSDAAALHDHGASGMTALGSRYVREDRGVSDPVRTDVAGIASHDPGTAVRLRLRFSSRSVPGCGSTGDAPCDIATLASGRAHFDILAFDAASDAPVIVRTTYPAALAPLRVYGTQQTDREPIDDLFASRAGTIFGTWARALRTAWIDRDPGLPVNRPWLAPTILLVAALLLVVGRRIGYPVFRLTDAPALPVSGGGPIPVLVSGRLSRPAGGPIDVEAAPGRLLTDGSASTELEVETPDGLLRSPISQSLRAISAVERGDLVHLGGREPALALHWFGNDVVLAFRTDADRDRAEALVSA